LVWTARNINEQLALIDAHSQAVMSKWFGESEGLLAKVFKAAEALGGAIIFIVSKALLQTCMCTSPMVWLDERDVSIDLHLF